MKKTQKSLLGLVSALAAAVPASHGQVILHPQHIKGVVQFTNRNLAVLNVLTNPIPVQHTFRLVLDADALPPAAPLRTTAIVETNALAIPYDLTVDAGSTGIAYKLSPSWQAGPQPPIDDSYKFQPQSTALLTTNQPPATLNFSDCAGILDLHFVRGGQPMAIQALEYHVYPVSASVTVADAYAALSNTTSVTSRTILVPGGGNYRTVVIYGVGTNDYLDSAQYTVTLTNAVRCDEIVAANIEVPSAGQLANVRGNVALVGEFEMTVPDNSRDFPGMTTIIAHSAADQFGRNRNTRYASVRGTNFVVPASGPFVLTNMTPSSGLLVDDYTVYGKMVVRSNRDYVLFSTPALGSGQNPGLSLTPGGNVDLSDTFVIHPGYLRTRFLLQGPPEAEGFPSGLRNLYFDLDSTASNGIPNDVAVNGTVNGGSSATYATMFGVNRLAAGASYTASGGSSSAFGPGSFNPTNASYDGQLEFPLGGLGSQPSVWQRGRVWIVMHQDSTNGQPYVSEAGYGTPDDNGYGAPDGSHTVTISAGQTIASQLDFSYCLSEVWLRVHSASGLFSAPQVVSSGGLTNGVDFLNQTNHYFFNMTAHGTPRDPATTNDGLVVMYLPQGSYTVNPFVEAQNPDGSSTHTALQPLNLSVGCGQRLFLTTAGLQVQLNAPRCASVAQVPISGQVFGSNAIASITVSVNGGPATGLCNNCPAANPTYSATVTIPAAQCSNSTVTVATTDVASNTASTTASIVFSTQRPTISCPANIVAPCNGLGGTAVSFNATAAGGCPGPMTAVCTPPSGSLFLPGTTTVSCVAVDAYGCQSDPCTFTVTVTDTTPPVINCPTNLAVDCAGPSGALAFFQVTATDNCDPNATVVCAPPSGSVFPLGTNTVRCTASDHSGNSNQCSFQVLVRPAVLSITKTVTIQWCGVALQGSDSANGPWTDIPGATNPYTVASDKAKQFYRARQ